MPERRIDVPTPLFDRLVDRKPQLMREGRPRRTLDANGLVRSVARELEQLFNTRTSLTAEDLRSRPRTVVEYGIPDFSTFSAASPDDWPRLAGWMAAAVEAYEPRLQEVEVEVVGPGPRHRGLAGSIRGVLVVGQVRQPVSFDTVIYQKEGRVEIDGHG